MDENSPSSAGRLRVGKQWEESLYVYVSVCVSVCMCQNSLIREKKTSADNIQVANKRRQDKKRERKHTRENINKEKSKSFEEVK